MAHDGAACSARRATLPTMDATSPDQPASQGGRPPGYTLTEAAEILGISRDAVRGRVRRGTLLGWLQGGRWLVDVNAPVGQVGRSQPATDQPHSQPLDDRDHLVEQLRSENVYLRERLV